jgi:general secretion pathway protein A
MEEVGSYIRHRLHVAGSDEEIFNEEAIQAISEYSNGIPRLINILSNNALVYAYADEHATVDEGIVHAVVEDANETGLLSFGRS